MASSDDEGEVGPPSVSVYEFVVGKDEPISLAELPVQWNKCEIPDGEHKKIFLRGSIDEGLQKIYKQVIAWKFDLSNEKPEISVLTKENHWIRLLNPRKAFEDIIRTILITVHCLHFLKRNPGTSHKALWDHLGKVFRLFEPRPSENDLVDHFSLIDEAVKRDPTLAKSKLLVTFLEEKPSKRKAFSKDMRTTSKSNFIVDGSEDEDDISDEVDYCFDPVCAICDNGGNILCCEGKCMRSFHTTTKEGADSQCASLGLTRAELEDLENIDFYCKNCKYNQHQCFVCGKLGSSDESRGAEVFRCVNGACGHFYHPGCVAKLLHKGNDAAAEELQMKIAAGEQFACPLHKCHVCEEIEVRSDPKLQFAVCRRCPKAYHRKCLPREIAFSDKGDDDDDDDDKDDDDDDEDENIVQRAWEGLIPNRILIYCLEHDIVKGLSTPVRDHIKFPGSEEKEKKQQPLEAHDKQQPLEASDKKKVLVKQRSFASEDVSVKKSSAKPLKRVEKQVCHSQKRGGTLSGPLSFKRQKVASSNNCREKPKESNITTEGRMSLGEQLYRFKKDLDSVKSKQVERADGEQGPSQKIMPKGTSNMLSLDSDAQKRILDIMETAKASVTLGEVVAKHKTPSTYVQSSKYVVDKNLTSGRVEGALEAIRAALLKIESGSITDAKSVCGTDLLRQVIKWKNKLKVYLSPFIYGMRYTSFGRHFTKLEKFQEIADILHWYVKDGDMIVDFSCGSNDFSCLMKKKLDEMQKSCSFKNYDIMQAKDDFCFEKRDFMGVQPKELPTGSKLIMGLNPPFGTNASLAYKFINKALEFKPKLLILIVPKETQRLDDAYDLIWEDDQMLSGKSFYLPGSVDVNDKQMEDWNKNPPPLYLWSRPDWTRKHKDIALQHGHLSKDQRTSSLQENRTENVSVASGQPSNLDELPVHEGNDRDVGNDRQEHRIPQETRKTTSHQEELGNNIQEHQVPQETRETTSPKEESPHHDLNNRQEHREQETKATTSHKKESPRDGGNNRQETRLTTSHKEGSPRDAGNNRQEKGAIASHKKESPRDDRNNRQETRLTTSRKKESPRDDGNKRQETKALTSHKEDLPHDDRNNRQETRLTTSHKKESPRDDLNDRQETRAITSHNKESPRDDQNNRQETRATSSHKKELPNESSVSVRDKNHVGQKTQSKPKSEDINDESAKKRKQDENSAGKHSSSSQPRWNVDGGRLLDGHSQKSLERSPVEMESSSRPYKQARHSRNLEKDDLVAKYIVPNRRSHTPNLDDGLIAKYTVPNRQPHTPNREYRYSIPDQSMGYPRGSTDIHGYRSHEMERGLRDVNFQSNLNLLGGTRDVPHSWAPGPVYPPPYGPPVSSGNSAYGGMNTSAMQRYAPRLDELNHTRRGPLLADPNSLYRNPIPRGFAPGRHHPYPQYNSSGWLND